MPKFSFSKNTAASRLIIGLGITIISCFMMTWRFPPLELLELKLLDARFAVRGKIKPPDSVLIAAIDEKSIEKLGRWPWSRDILASLIGRLADSDAAVIALDIILSEQERNDRILKSALNKAGNVILPIVFDFHSSPAPSGDLLNGTSAFQTVKNPELFSVVAPITASKVLLPVRDLRENAMALGHINMFPDSDGTLRWEPLAIAYHNRLYPSLPLQAATAFLGISPDQLVLDSTRGVILGKTYIPTDEWGRNVINYYGSGETFPHISIADIIEGKIDKAFFANKIILVGATAVGIYDLRVTPFAAAMPGVEKHASVIASILDRRFIRKLPLSTNLLIVGLSGLLLSLLLARGRITLALIATILSLVLTTSAIYLLFARFGLWINLAMPGCNIIAIFIGITTYNYTVEEQRARKIRAMFSSYITQTIVNELINNPDMAKLGGERREVTVLFSDIKGFTTFSEQHTPEEVVALLNEYLGAMTDVILKWDGTLDKFIGDAIIVFWGAPLRSERHAEQAVLCALEMTATLARLQEKWANEGKAPLCAGIGVNTGEVLVGNIGAEGKKMDYTIIGDQVNLGSRIETLTRIYDVPILVTEYTVERLKDGVNSGRLKEMAIEGIELVIVKGKETPVGIYSVKVTKPGAPAIISEYDSERVVRYTEK